MSSFDSKYSPTSYIAAVVTSALLMAGCGSRLSDEQRVEQARVQLARGDAPTAAIQLRTVLQQDPTNVEARVLLAEAGLVSGDIETAAKEYRRALELGAELDDLRVPYAEALVRAGLGQEALRVTDPEEAGDVPELAYWRGLALLRVGRVEEAQAAFESAARTPPLQSRAQVGLARVALHRQRVAEAIALLEPAPPGMERDADFWEVLGLALARDGKYDAAAAAFARAGDVAVDAVGHRRLMLRTGEVEALLAAGRLPEARQLAEQIHAQTNRHPLANYLMGRVELQSGNPQQALAYGQAVLAVKSDSAEGHLIIGMAHLALEESIQAERSFERAVAADPGNMNARQLLAQTRLGLQSPGRALEALGPIIDESVDPGTATLAGLASVRAGDPTAAIDIFRRQLERNPDDDQARSMLGISLMSAGRIDEALAELAQVSADDAAVRQRADLLTIAAQLKSGSLSEAREGANRLAATIVDDAALRTSLGGLFLSANHLDDAVAWLEDAVRLEPHNPGAHFGLGRVAVALGQWDAARTHFSTMLDADPRSGAALMAMAQLEWTVGNRDDALGFLEQARAAEPRDLDSRIVLSTYLSELNRSAEALAVAQEAIALAPESARAANTLGTALLLSGRAAEALGQFSVAHQISPSLPLYLINKARAELAIGQLGAARQSLISALALDPEHLEGLAVLFDVERRRGDLDGAARALNRLERAAPPGNPRVALFRGQLILARENFPEAERAFVDAIARGAGDRAVIGVYESRRRGNARDAEQPLIEWLREHPQDRNVRTVLGAHYVEKRDYPAAIEQYMDVLEAVPDDLLALNNLSWLYHQAGDTRRALEFAERAYRQAPDNPRVADTLGWILHKQGDNVRALELLGQAARDAPSVGEIQYHHAVVLAETGDTSAALRAARAVLAEASAANHHEAAQKLLDRLDSGARRTE
jgi:cellulose synthase operon protein C